MSRHLVSLVIGLAILTSLVARTSAQEYAPRDISLLKALGLPEINLVATETEVTGAPTTETAGRYLVTLENQTADTEVEVFLLSPPAGLTTEQALADINARSDGPPTWIYDSALAGGPNPYGGQTDGVVVDLTPGTWWFLVQHNNEPPVWHLFETIVSGVASTATEIAGAVPVDLQEYAFVLPEKMTAGQQIWKVSNTGEQPHFFVLAKLPDGTTADAVMDFLMSLESGEGGTPAASMSGLSEEDFSFIYDSSFVSADHSMWVQVGLEAGTYGLICWFPDKDTGAPHVAMGMLGVFTVE